MLAQGVRGPFRDCAAYPKGGAVWAAHPWVWAEDSLDVRVQSLDVVALVHRHPFPSKCRPRSVASESAPSKNNTHSLTSSRTFLGQAITTHLQAAQDRS